jgi:hypothetical protein
MVVGYINSFSPFIEGKKKSKTVITGWHVHGKLVIWLLMP